MMLLTRNIWAEADLTENDRPPVLNSVDLGLTVLFTFFWLTAASSLAWAKGQIYGFTTPEVWINQIQNKIFWTSHLEFHCGTRFERHLLRIRHLSSWSRSQFWKTQFSYCFWFSQYVSLGSWYMVSTFFMT